VLCMKVPVEPSEQGAVTRDMSHSTERTKVRQCRVIHPQRASSGLTSCRVVPTDLLIERRPYGKNFEPKLLFRDVRPKIPLLWFLSALSIFYRLPPTQ
jgi:hypothetical protein